MTLSIQHGGYATTDYRPVSRRYAWSVFAIIFALMVVDFVDRQVVVSIFTQAAMESLRRIARRARVRGLDHSGARHRSALAARGSMEPREEHFPDGARVGSCDDRLCIRRKLRAVARRTQRR